uniref:Peptidase C14 caspase domain-containing protein n=1 Tax=Setaria italica TaxID=4555 RepID=K3ZD96_SETIT
MRRCLVDRFGFDAADIRVLADADTSTPPPTGANIRRLVGDARPGDTLFFHYSGHGLQLPAETGEDDDTGYDECIVPGDGNLIKVSDSCHSGGLIDKAKKQIGNSTRQNKNQHPDQRETRPPFYASLLGIVHGAFESLSIHLHRRGFQQSSRSQSNGAELDTKAEVKGEHREDGVGVGTIRTTLFRHFGDDVSAKLKKFAQVMAAGKLRQDGELLEGDELGQAETRSRAAASGQEVRSSVKVKEVYAGTAASVPLPRNGVLISGCQTDQTSGDATTAEGVSYACSTTKKYGAVTSRELVLRARELLAKQGVTTQQPGLYCSDEHASVPFVC